MHSSPLPVLATYLYVHGQEEGFHYPTVRATQSASGAAVRYLECAVTQAATLRASDVPCEVVLATNIGEPRALGRAGTRLIGELEALDVRILPTEYRHRPEAGTEIYVSSRYVLDAILATAEGQPEDRELWFTDVDCVWIDPRLVFANAPSASEIGCIHIGYEPDWDVVGFGAHGRTRAAIGALAASMGVAHAQPPSWVGGELLGGRPAALRQLVRACEELDAQMAGDGGTLPTEEQILSLAGALGRVSFHELSHVARRVPTGPRNRAAMVDDPLALGLWHVPAEKGLSLRRTAREIGSHGLDRLRRDLADGPRAARRFNVAGTGPLRQVVDDGWIVRQRVRGMTSGIVRGRLRGA